ncbi:NTP transferase domain-containing protein [Micromonospora sp. NPDC048830]|uniref:nucleotidyltransferase family protein n=1 Tax=Micromonospora sp. NPDC048830 TaxID=3364257 RepID=UPI00371203E6
MRDAAPHGEHSVAGVLLAAGAGIRYGGPKALVDGWLAGAATALRDGGCDPVLVVLGAAADEARHLVPNGAEVVVAADWAEGMGAALRAGLSAAEATAAAAALVHLVDLPDVGPAVVRRLLAAAAPDALARAIYRSAPGHPVLLGREHWNDVVATAVGDQGARAFLRAHAEVVEIECGDIADGHDVDLRKPE